MPDRLFGTIPAPATTIVLVVTGLVTFIAFRRRDLWHRWMFKPHEILRYKQYERLLTSGFIHLDWTHFIVNAFTLYAFGRNIEFVYGARDLLLIHFSGIIGGSFLSLFIHRHHDYSALGASGGVCGVIYASIFLLPGGNIQMMFIPIPIPAFAYAIGYLIWTFVKLRKRLDNIGHDAHLGGAIVGLLVATVLHPQLVLASPGMFAAVLVLSVVMLAVIVLDPMNLWQELAGVRARFGDDRDHRYEQNRSRNRKIEEIDRLLEKVGAQGIHSLSKAEREQLDRLSKDIGRRD